MTAGLRLRAFQFTFEAAPALAYPLDNNDVPEPVQPIVRNIFAPSAAAIPDGMGQPEPHGTSVEGQPTMGTDTGEDLEGFDADGDHYCDICHIACSSLAQLHEHLEGPEHRRHQKWFVRNAEFVQWEIRPERIGRS